MIRQEYSVYGVFKITTEGDCEGRSVRDLGTYKGYIDEIAFALADKCYYSLTFHQINPEEHKLDMTPKRKEVNITLDIDSGTWDLKGKDRIKYFENFFKDRNVEISNGNCYGGVKISTNKKTKEEKKQEILNKLTDEEKEILGLN